MGQTMAIFRSTAACWNLWTSPRANTLSWFPIADHLGKDLESVARVIVDLENRGAKVTCDDENLPDPVQNSLQTLGIKGVSRTRSERIKEAMRARALKARALGRPPYGYRNGSDGRLQIVSEESPVVELIYRLYTKEDLGIRLIAQHLNEREIPTRRGGKWNMITIRDILRNPGLYGNLHSIRPAHGEKSRGHNSAKDFQGRAGRQQGKASQR